MSSQSLGYFPREVIEAACERRRVGREIRTAQAMDEIKAERRLAAQSVDTKIVCPHCLAAFQVEMSAPAIAHQYLDLPREAVLPAKAIDQSIFNPIQVLIEFSHGESPVFWLVVSTLKPSTGQTLRPFEPLE